MINFERLFDKSESLLSCKLFFTFAACSPAVCFPSSQGNSLLSKFKNLDCAVFGISKDDMRSHDKFKEKYKVKFDLLSDEKKEALKAFKVWGKKKFMGKEFMGVIRSTFVIKNNKIIKEWRSVKVKDHAKEVLEFIKKTN